MLIIKYLFSVIKDPLSLPIAIGIPQGGKALIGAGAVEKVFLTAKDAKEFAKDSKTNHL